MNYKIFRGTLFEKKIIVHGIKYWSICVYFDKNQLNAQTYILTYQQLPLVQNIRKYLIYVYNGT